MPPETLDSLDKDALKPIVLALIEQNRLLLARVAELEAQLGKPPKTPDNSSLPPSAGRKPSTDETPAAGSKRRKGRPGVARALAENPDVTRDIRPSRCACGAALADAGAVLAHAWDHVDLPPIRPVTTRINLYRATCPCCRRAVTATAPADMPQGSPFGPGIAAAVAYLHGCHMVSYKRLVELLGGLFGVTLSQGAIANILARAGRPLAAAAEKIAAVVRSSEVVASDETSARVEGRTWWQWTFGCATAVYHLIAPTRSKRVPVEFLGGARPKVWLSDRYAGQAGLAEAQQFCLAHLIRDAQYAIDHGDAIFAPPFQAFLKAACDIARRRGDLADGTIDSHRRRLARDLEALLALEPTDSEGRRLRDAIDVDCRDRLLVFLTRRDVEPTNNESERDLRPCVIFRKVTNGFRSEWGAKVYADLCSLVATGRRSGHSPLASIRAALAHTAPA